MNTAYQDEVTEEMLQQYDNPELPFTALKAKRHKPELDYCELSNTFPVRFCMSIATEYVTQF